MVLLDRCNFRYYVVVSSQGGVSIVTKSGVVYSMIMNIAIYCRLCSV